MNVRPCFLMRAWLSATMAILVSLPISGQQPPAPRPTVYQTTLEEPNQQTAEITTEQLQQILAAKSEPVFDVRTAKEYAIAHIPGTINIYEKEVEQIASLYPDKSNTHMILYCNGPSCGKSKRTSEQLIAIGYPKENVRRYQLGLPVWRALSLTVQTDMAGFDYIFRGDKTAVFVDARTPAEHAAATVPGAVNVQKGEATAANDDGRLPFTDKGTRVVVFANTASDAQVVAAEIAKKAYWNSSYFGGTFGDLDAAGFINHRPVAMSKGVTVPAGPSCTATLAPASVDAGSFDLDPEDALALSLDLGGPFGLGEHAVSLIATDSHQLSSASTSIATVVDETAPAISPLAVDETVLWPPNHRMVVVTIGYTATDNCGPVATELLVSMSHGSDRRDTGDKDVASSPDRSVREDWEVIDAHHVSLKAERDRTYWITVVAADDAGNRSARSVGVRATAPER
jgi:rhodanese-related sulfurtransferase